MLHKYRMYNIGCTPPSRGFAAAVGWWAGKKKRRDGDADAFESEGRELARCGHQRDARRSQRREIRAVRAAVRWLFHRADEQKHTKAGFELRTCRLNGLRVGSTMVHG